MHVAAAVEEYMLFVSPGKQQTTLDTYRYSLHLLIVWCEGNEIADLAQLDRPAIRRFIAESAAVYGQYTLRNIVSVTRRLLRWAKDEGLMPEDLSGYIRTPPIRARLQRALTRDEVNTLLEACDNSPAGLRNAAIISLLIDTGLRASEIVSLNVSDVNMKSQSLKVRIKGGTEYNVRFGDHTRRRLQDWLREHDGPPTRPLFVSLGGFAIGKRLSRNGLRVVLAKLGTDTGVNGVTVHAFRRTFATELLRSGVPTRIVQILGRWNDMEMVALYSKQLEQENIAISLADIFANE